MPVLGKKGCNHIIGLCFYQAERDGNKYTFFLACAWSCLQQTTSMNSVAARVIRLNRTRAACLLHGCQGNLTAPSSLPCPPGPPTTPRQPPLPPPTPRLIVNPKALSANSVQVSTAMEMTTAMEEQPFITPNNFSRAIVDCAEFMAFRLTLM